MSNHQVYLKEGEVRLPKEVDWLITDMEITLQSWIDMAQERIDQLDLDDNEAAELQRWCGIKFVCGSIQASLQKAVNKRFPNQLR